MSSTDAPEGSADTSVVGGPTREQLRGGAVGIAVLAYFALAWTGWGASTGMPTAVEIPVISAAALCTLTLFGGAVFTYRRGASVPPGVHSAQGRSIGRRFGVIVAAEFIGLAIIAWIPGVTGHPQLIPAIVCLGVGIHFFPLRRLFAVPIYDRTGTALCVIALATVVLAPVTGQPRLWTMLPGLGAALTLYITCALLLRGNTTGTRHAPAPAATPPPEAQP